ncbi:DUF2607 family protein [Aeromonas finlandensis]|uniref:DUF2607 family protein n=1 Tax=Aeromonas finlandensis TaxID=1543375 RepID=UPI00051C1D9F|nr:DUF2607 family protein [Aeromonas finlandensis]
MGRIKLKIWIVLLGWLWLQPLLAQHQLESALPGHDDHHCLVCALHLDGKQALAPAPHCYADKTTDTPVVATMQRSADVTPPHNYAIRAPPLSAFLYPFV